MSDLLPSFLTGKDGKLSIMAVIGSTLVILAIVALGMRVKPLRRLIAGG